MRSTRFLKARLHRREAEQPGHQGRDRIRDVRRLERGHANAWQRSRNHLPLVVRRAYEVDAEATVDLEVDEAGGENSAVERHMVDGCGRPTFDEVDDPCTVDQQSRGGDDGHLDPFTAENPRWRVWRRRLLSILD